MQLIKSNLSEVQDTEGWKRLKADKQLNGEVMHSVLELMCPPAKRLKSDWCSFDCKLRSRDSFSFSTVFNVIGQNRLYFSVHIFRTPLALFLDAVAFGLTMASNC